MRFSKDGIVVLVLLATLAFLPTRAAAAPIPLLVTHGDAIEYLAAVPVEQRQALREATGYSVAIGYTYSYVGLFWLNLWTWGGKYCLYRDKSYWSLSPTEAAELLGVPENKLPKPFFYSYPPLLDLSLAAIVLFALIRIFVKTHKVVKERRAASKVDD